MKFIINLLLFTVLLFANSASSKIYFGQSAIKVKKKGVEFTLKKIDSDEGFKVVKTQVVGNGVIAPHYFSPSGKYLVVYLSKKRKHNDELVVYSTDDFNEVLRVEVGKFP